MSDAGQEKHLATGAEADSTPDVSPKAAPRLVVDPPVRRVADVTDDDLTPRLIKDVFSGVDSTIPVLILAGHLYRHINKGIHRSIPADARRDLKQDVMFKLLANLEALREESSVVPWLRQVARNMSIDWFRRNKPELLGDKADHLASHDSDLSNELMARDMWNKALDELTIEEQDVISAILNGYSIREAGRLVGLSTMTTQRRKDEALRKLRAFCARNGVKR